jgi:hypothetical protein
VIPQEGVAILPANKRKREPPQGLPQWLWEVVLLVMLGMLFFVSLASLATDFGGEALREISKYALGGIVGSLLTFLSSLIRKRD